MSSQRFRRLTAIISGALLGLALIGPAPTVAAQAGWEFINKELLPSMVTPGAAAGYRFTIHNGGSSNISQLYLTASVNDLPAGRAAILDAPASSNRTLREGRSLTRKPKCSRPLPPVCDTGFSARNTWPSHKSTAALCESTNLMPNTFL